MRAKLTIDNKFIQLYELSDYELKQLKISFTKKINNWFIIKRKSPFANVDESFINKYNMIPIGLWVELVKIATKYKLNLIFDEDFDNNIKDNLLTIDNIKSYCNNLFKNSDIQPYDYQIDAVYKMLKYKKCCVEISTSGGKTLISYIYFKYLHDICGIKHFLYVTPNTTLTTQSGEKFKQYDKKCGIDSDWTFEEIHSGQKKKSEYNATIVFGNYQSLCKKKSDFFDKYECIIQDECHHGSNTSLRNIMSRSLYYKYCVGLTGTFPKEGTYDNFIIQSYIGPLIHQLTSYDLINKENKATPIYIVGMELNYLDNETKSNLFELRKNKDKDDIELSNKLLNMEKRLVRDNRKRLLYICDVINKTTKNSLIIFSDVQNNYGKNIYEYLKSETDKSVFYIDGNTPTKNRDYYISEMENDINGNTIIVASIGTFSEGVDIANLWNIFVIETTKSDRLISQIIGRGMRNFPGKDKVMLFDFADNFDYGSGYQKTCYLMRHFKERCSIYKKRKFPIKIFKISL